jgi:hypothetical protein
MDEIIKSKVLKLAQAELNRGIVEANSSNWDLPELEFKDGDDVGKLSIYMAPADDFPKGHWLVYIHYPYILHPSTFMAFSKKTLSLVYYGRSYDEG